MQSEYYGYLMIFQVLVEWFTCVLVVVNGHIKRVLLGYASLANLSEVYLTLGKHHLNTTSFYLWKNGVIVTSEKLTDIHQPWSTGLRFKSPYSGNILLILVTVPQVSGRYGATAKQVVNLVRFSQEKTPQSIFHLVQIA